MRLTNAMKNIKMRLIPIISCNLTNSKLTEQKTFKKVKVPQIYKIKL